MATITQNITDFPAAPDSVNDTAPTFNTKANAFVAHQSDVYVGEVNTWAAQANAVRDDINNISASLPAGTINDTVVGLGNTFSSNKILDENGRYPLSASWDGVILTEVTVPKLSEVGIIGANPNAKLYPDGTIVGGSDNGEFTKYPNGMLSCAGGTAAADTLTAAGGVFRGDSTVLTFPIVFITRPSVSSSSSTNNVWFTQISDTNTTNMRPYAHTTYSGIVGYYSAQGRWK